VAKKCLESNLAGTASSAPPVSTGSLVGSVVFDMCQPQAAALVGYLKSKDTILEGFREL